jgi:hypothetical protein
MQGKQFLNPTRVYLLIRNAIVLNRAAILFTSAALAGLLSILSLFDTYGNCAPMFHRNAYMVIFFPVGILLTSRAFRQLHDSITGYSWLLLPASSLEKTLSQILITTLVYSLGSLVIYLLFSLFSEGINMLVLRRCHSMFNPFDSVIITSIGVYMAIQAPFLIGAVYFKKHALRKTILVLTFSVLIIGVVLLIATQIIFGKEFFWLNVKDIFYSDAYGDFTAVGLSVINTAKVLFWFAVPLVSWIICYFRCRETEL